VGTTVTQVGGGLLWTASIVGFAALAAAILGWLPASWFPPLAVGSAVASLAGLLLFPIAFPTFSTLGALAIDLAVLVVAIWYESWSRSDPAKPGRQSRRGAARSSISQAWSSRCHADRRT
jgi:hypothetical protein